MLHSEQVEKLKAGELDSVLIEPPHPYNWVAGRVHAVQTCKRGRALGYARISRVEQVSEREWRLWVEQATVFDYLRQWHPDWQQARIEL